MNPTLKGLLVAIGLAGALAAQAQAQVPADAPAGTTVQCKDGSYAAPDTRSAACRGHKGIKTWYGKADAAAKPAPAVPDPSKMAGAPGGGAGKVWANEETKVYHCMGDRYYGKTKKGGYLSEADAKAKGMHASHGKACAA